LSVLDEIEQHIPATIQEAAFTDEIMSEVYKLDYNEENPIHLKERTNKNKTIFHYIIASAMTLMLLFSGVFSNFTNILDSFETQSKKEKSVVSGLMNQQ